VYCPILLVSLLAAVPVGGAAARGSFLADGILTWWQTTLFEGSVVEASRVAVRVWMGGSRWVLAAGASGRAHGGWFELEKGTAVATGITAAGGARIEGRGYRITVTKGAAPAVLYAGDPPKVVPEGAMELRRVPRIPPPEGAMEEEQRPLSQRP